jgi:hypothetical protein
MGLVWGPRDWGLKARLNRTGETSVILRRPPAGLRSVALGHSLDALESESSGISPPSG